ncbi:MULTISPECIES: alpha/beta fold hydrolase [unclassified Azospirillum]|uniref:alpha/beta fold hydrolase n=1 Tax=unclassified Azospirillum TaxID=2630922 RepID=UPI000B6D160F|nr:MULTISPECIES: alpha/beta hydrolase [unclassified Azospirillum]SNS90670.1 Pimeloyl-ACP methyl ester carboxylesterase [Azospirillum sp. RU38E]SNT07761.1 Pimeloyl-ACP methyl ester carboxylesterase [Azospirillum sp. RU37A]
MTTASNPNILQSAPNSSAARTQFVESDGRRLAYRVVGAGKPLLLCNRFRGVLDLWDPAFIDALAAQGFQVITFDYSGLGQSTGEATYNPLALAKDGKDLIEALGLKNPAIGGWSIGGIAAQILLAMTGDMASHLVLLATTPPGPLVKSGEQLFYDTAALPGISLDQFTTVFFEPADAASRQASKRSFERITARTEDRSPDVPAEWAIAQIGSEPRNPLFPSPEILQLLKATNIPVLHLGGDHDIVMPVENWYALNGELPTLHLVTYPRAGHGPHHQHPQMAAAQIAAFIQGTHRS